MILGKRKDAYLSKLYSDLKYPTSFTGVEKLYRYAKRDGKYKLSRNDVKKYLSANETYTVHRPAVRKFPRRSVIPIRPFQQFQLDSRLD